MVATAEKNIITNAAQKEENLNVQILVDKQTKDLKVGFPHHHNRRFLYHTEWMIRRGDEILLRISQILIICFKYASHFSIRILYLFFFAPLFVIGDIYQLNCCLMTFNGFYLFLSDIHV